MLNGYHSPLHPFTLSNEYREVSFANDNYGIDDSHDEQCHENRFVPRHADRPGNAYQGEQGMTEEAHHHPVETNDGQRAHRQVHYPLGGIAASQLAGANDSEEEAEVEGIEQGDMWQQARLVNMPVEEQDAQCETHHA